jgi:hypothetical protein
MSALEDRLRDTLHQRATLPRPGDDLAGAAIPRARNRPPPRVGVDALAIAVFVVATIAGVSLAGGPSAAPNPAITVGPGPSPSPSTQSTVDTTGAQHGIGLDVLDHFQLISMEGKRFTLPVTHLAYLFRVPAGWLYGDWDTPGALLRADGTTMPLSALRLSMGGTEQPVRPAVSADGRSVAWVTDTTLYAATVTQSGLSDVVSSPVPAGGFALSWIGSRVVVGHSYDGACCGGNHAEYDVWDPVRGNFVAHWTRGIYPFAAPVPNAVPAYIRVVAPGSGVNEACLARVDGATSMAPLEPRSCPAGLGWYSMAAMLGPDGHYLVDTDQRDRSLAVYSVLDPSAVGPVMHCAADVPLAWESDIAIIAYDKRTGQVVRCVVGSTTVVPLGRFDSEWSLVPRYGI